MNTDQIKLMIRACFSGKGWSAVWKALLRWWFVFTEQGHATVNITREILRALGAPDAAPGERNWADELSRWGTVAVVATLLLWLISLTPIDPPTFVDE